MTIQIDSREKARAIKSILAEFDRQGKKYVISKMYVADYCLLENPLFVIDRKQNIQEIAQNATSGHDRFKREIQRLEDIGGQMIILVEQDNIDGKPINELSDLMLWQSHFGEVDGMRVYRILDAWEHKHNLKVIFCNKQETGAKIIELLDGGLENAKHDS